MGFGWRSRHGPFLSVRLVSAKDSRLTAVPAFVETNTPAHVGPLRVFISAERVGRRYFVR